MLEWRGPMGDTDLMAARNAGVGWPLDQLGCFPNSVLFLWDRFCCIKLKWMVPDCSRLQINDMVVVYKWYHAFNAMISSCQSNSNYSNGCCFKFAENLQNLTVKRKPNSTEKSSSVWSSYFWRNTEIQLPSTLYAPIDHSFHIQAFTIHTHTSTEASNVERGQPAPLLC